MIKNPYEMDNEEIIEEYKGILMDVVFGELTESESKRVKQLEKVILKRMEG